MRNYSKRKWTVQYILASLLLLVFFGGGNIRSRAEEPIAGELIILVDVSGSVDAYGNDIKEWAMWLGDELRDTDIRVTLREFADPGYASGAEGYMISSMNGEDVKSINEYYIDVKKITFEK